MYNLQQLIDDEDAFQLFTSGLADSGNLPSLRCAKIKVTPRCNLQCSMCTYWSTDRGPELTTAELVKVLEDLKALGCMKVHLSGGELFIRDDILEILEKARALRFKVNITTNGTLINKKIATRLIKLKLNSITLSLDGSCQGLHDSIRGVKGAYRKMMEGLRFLNAAKAERGGKTKLRINSVLQRDNFRDIPEIVTLAGLMGIHEVRVMPVDAKKTDRTSLSKKQIREYNNDIVPEIIKNRVRSGFSSDEHVVYPFGKKKAAINLAKEGKYSLGFYEQHLCYAPWLHTFIAWDGSVSLCCTSRGKTASLGNVLDLPIGGIFCGEPYREMRAMMKTARFDFCHYCDDFIDENRKIDAAIKEVNFRHGEDRL
ncbi:MAG: radical SAM/SPASM domain-containing protein [Candidatus Xenobiia bacterium LiM19]